jgi:hypothetical protein
MLRFQPQEVVALNRSINHVRISQIQRRMWNAMEGIDCLFDFDVCVPFQMRRFPGQNATDSTYSLARLSRIPAGLCSARISVGTGVLSPIIAPTPLRDAGDQIARRFATETATEETRAAGCELVRSGQPVLVMEAPGLNVRIDAGIPVDRCWVGELEFLSFALTVGGARPLRCYVLTSGSNSSAARRMVREVRIHVLRLHSIREFMLGLVGQARSEPCPLSAEPSESYDRLQYAISVLIRALQRSRRPSKESSQSLLPDAFLAHEFVNDSELEVLGHRLLAAARPAVLAQLGLPAEGLQVATIMDKQKGQFPDVPGWVLNVKNYDMRGANIGAAGDYASAANFTQHGPQSVLTIDGRDFDQSRLISELAVLRTALDRGYSGVPLAQQEKSRAAIELAEAEAQRGNAAGVKASLAKVGRWVLQLANTTSCTVAAAAINHALGLQ